MQFEADLDDIEDTIFHELCKQINDSVRLT